MDFLDWLQQFGIGRDLRNSLEPWQISQIEMLGKKAYKRGIDDSKRAHKFRGYRCENKTSTEILETLGFTQEGTSRGWILLRIRDTKGLKPVRIHAIIHRDDDKVEYIDAHADFEVDGKHITQRGRRIERFNELFSQIDHGMWCDAGIKVTRHYKDIGDKVAKYNEEILKKR